MSRLNGLPLDPQPNLPLIPVDNGKIGNAILVGFKDGFYIVVTDFGNLIKFTSSELRETFSVPDWYYEMPKDYPRDTLRLRFSKQIILLKKVLEDLDD
jgi:hypothetical protein